MSGDATRKAIEQELRYIAQKIHSGGLEESIGWGIQPPLLNLQELVSQLQPADSESQPKETLLTVLRQAVVQLEDERMEIGGLSYRYAAERLFGLVSPDIPVASGRSYDHVVNLLLQEANVLPTQTRDRRRFTVSIRRRVADKLLLLPAQKQKAKGSSSTPDAEDQIERGTIIGEIEAALSSAGGRVILWGESGNGKTFLAEAVVARHENWQRVLRIRGSIAHNTVLFHANIISALEIAGIDARGWALGACCTALRDVVSQPDAVDLLLLDDADEETIEYFTRSAGVRTIVTTQIRPRIPDVSMIAIHSFTAQESLAYWMARLPSADAQGAREITRRLGQRPLALYIGTSMVRAGIVSDEELLEVCRTDTPGLVDAGIELIGDSGTRSLTAVYKRLVDFIEADAIAMQMLMAIIWLTDGLLFKEMISTMAFPSLRVLPTSISRGGAYSKLLRCGLLRETIRDVEMNDLSLAILRNLLAAESDAQVRQFFDGVWAIGLHAASVGESGVLADVKSDPLGDMWESIIDQIPQPSGDRDAAHKSISAGEIAAIRSTLMVLAPGVNFGCFTLTQHTWLFWQKGCLFFTEPDGTDQLAVAYLKHGRIVTRPEMSPPSAREFAVNLLVPLSKVNMYAVDNFFRRLSTTRSGQFGPTTWRIGARGRRHLAAFAYAAPEVLADLSMPCWGRCGSLFFPSGVEDLEICDDCLELNSMAPESTWIEILGLWKKVMDYWGSRADWKFQFLLHATRASLLKEGYSPLAYSKRAAATIPGPHTDRTARLLHAWITAKVIEYWIRSARPRAAVLLGRTLRMLNNEDLHRPTERAILRSSAACLSESAEFSDFHRPLRALSTDRSRDGYCALKDLIGAVAKEWQRE